MHRAQKVRGDYPLTDSLIILSKCAKKSSINQNEEAVSSWESRAGKFLPCQRACLPVGREVRRGGSIN